MSETQTEGKMKTLKDLKVGDECFVMENHWRSKTTFAKARVVKVGRKWIETDYRKRLGIGYIFDIERGRHKSDYSAMAFLFPSEEVYQKTEGERVRREELQSEIRDSGSWNRSSDLTTEALERIVAIIRDPASKMATQTAPHGAEGER